MVCGWPFSVTTKSLEVSPSIGLPFLSFTETVSTTSWVVAWNFGADSGGGCWAEKAAAARRMSATGRSAQESRDDSRLSRLDSLRHDLEEQRRTQGVFSSVSLPAGDRRQKPVACPTGTAFAAEELLVVVILE